MADRARVNMNPKRLVAAHIDNGAYRMDVHRTGTDDRGTPDDGLTHLWVIAPKGPGMSPLLNLLCGGLFHARGTLESSLVTCPQCRHREERVRAFEFVRDMVLRMAEEWKANNQKKEG